MATNQKTVKTTKKVGSAGVGVNIKKATNDSHNQKSGKQVMAEQAPLTPEQQQSDMMSYLNSLRGNIILAYDGSKETASRAFDDVATKLIQYVRYAQKCDEMIAELKKENEKLKKGKK